MSYYSKHVLTLTKQIETWQNRARMAKKQGCSDLEQEALDYVAKYQKMLQDFETIEVDDSDDDPFTSSRVPIRPLPNEGAGSIALPLPVEENNESEDC